VTRERRILTLLAASLLVGGAAGTGRAGEIFMLGQSKGRVELRFGVGTVNANVLQNVTTERDWDATAYQPAFVFHLTGKGSSSDFRLRGLFSETEEVDDAEVGLDSYDVRFRTGWGWELRKRAVISLMGAISYRSWKTRIETDAGTTNYDAEVVCLGGYAHLRTGLVKDRLYFTAEAGAEAPVEGNAAYGSVGTSRVNGDVVFEARAGLDWRFAEYSWLSLGYAWEQSEMDFGGDPNTVDEITTGVVQVGLVFTF
jgi:hypothetical protein